MGEKEQSAVVSSCAFGGDFMVIIFATYIHLSFFTKDMQVQKRTVKLF